MSKTSFLSSRSLFLTCFMLVLVVFSTTMRFAGIDVNRTTIETNFSHLNHTEKKCNYSDYSFLDKQLDKNLDKKKNPSSSDTQQEKEPLTLKTTHSSDALLQAFVTAEVFQNAILTASLEFIFPSFSFDKRNSVSYYFSSSTFFKTLFRCFISPNAP